MLRAMKMDHIYLVVFMIPQHVSRDQPCYVAHLAYSALPAVLWTFAQDEPRLELELEQEPAYT